MDCRSGERNTVVSASDARAGAIRLEAKGLGRRDPKGDAWLLRGVNLKIEGGDRLAIVGPSGAGKTVLLRSLAMLDPHDEGQIVWQGRTVRGDEVPGFRTQVMYLHQRPALFDGSVEANLRQPYGLKAHRSARYDQEHVLELLEALGRDHRFLEKPHHDLSGGEGQIVALIRALQLDPAVVLLDEATSSLDRETARGAERLLDRWAQDGAGGRALIWVTHDPEQSNRVADHHLFFQAGRLHSASNRSE